MEQYKLIVFDWDGTLIDSIARIVSSLQHAATSLSLPTPSEAMAKSVIGLSLSEAFNVLFPGHSEEEQSALIASYKMQYREKDTTPSPLFNQTKHLLTSLKAQGRYLAVATGKGRVGLEKVWQETNSAHFFHSSICSDEAASKPAPEMLHRLLDEFSLQPEQALMIGDSKHDLKMANNASVDCVGVTLGVDNAEELSKYSPKAIVHSLEELHQLFHKVP